MVVDTSALIAIAFHEDKQACCGAVGFGDIADEPLLFKGDDFARTDIVPAWRP
jgi:uncharacterized protein with PIN domain